MCDCKVGPGKFEGEGVLTFLAYQSMLLGCSDTTTGGEGELVDWFRSPFGFDADSETVDAARAYGYCDTCIREALESEAYGISIWESEQGFVYGTVFTSREAFDEALADAEELDAEANEESEE